MAATTGLFFKAMLAAMGADDPATRDPRIKLTPNESVAVEDEGSGSAGRNASRRADLRGILGGRHMSGGASPTLLTGREGAPATGRRRALLGE